jgi:hypothetical protein
MKTEDVYKKVVSRLSEEIRALNHDDIPWLAFVARILRKRMGQKEVAIEMDAYDPEQVLDMLNGKGSARFLIEYMKNRPEIYGSLYKAKVHDSA